MPLGIKNCLAMWAFVLIVSFLILVHNSTLQEYCSADGTCAEVEHDRYFEESNRLAGEVNVAVRTFKPCVAQNCSCYFDVIKRDLKPFREGITKETIESIRSYGTKYQIIDHELYRQKECNFPSRCAGIEYFIKRILNKLPDMEMIINCRDWPQVGHNYPNQGPVFSFSKTSHYTDVMYPAWSFWEGGPAIKLYPKGIGRWDKHRKSLREASKKWPWNEKIPKAFFRGSRTSEERDSLVLLSRETPNLVDAQYTKNQAWKSPKDTLGAEPAEEVSLEEHCKYKYLFNFRGVTASFRFKHLFLCKSLVFHVGDEWKEFFYDALKPWVHYIPLKSNPSKEDIRHVLQFLQENDDMAEEIAARGYKLIQKILKLSDVECYWLKLLSEYAKLITYKVELDNELIKV